MGGYRLSAPLFGQTVEPECEHFDPTWWPQLSCFGCRKHPTTCLKQNLVSPAVEGILRSIGSKPFWKHLFVQEQMGVSQEKNDFNLCRFPVFPFSL